MGSAQSLPNSSKDTGQLEHRDKFEVGEHMTRRDKRRRLLSWLADLFRGTTPPIGGRRILVEPLEARQLMAADGFTALLGSAYDSSAEQYYGTTMLLGEGEMSAEGEDADDLVAFAVALADSGTRFFGAAWCPFCTAQKELFDDGYKFLPFVEVTNPDRSPNQIAIDEGITQYPTWEFPDGSRVTGLQTLQTLSQRSGVAIPQSSTPSLPDFANVNVGIGSPLHIPIDAYDPNGDPLTITVTSSNPSVLSADVLTGNRSWRLSVAGFGDMVFELFEDRVPLPTGRIIELTEDGFYDGIKFHRILNNFVIQGGDPLGNGTGGSTLGNFDDQFHLELQHNRTGVLSYAKSSDDTNDSQFFITEGPQRFLDFNHSVFGQLVEGEQIREAISNTAVVDSGGRPVNDVIIESATIFNDTENGVVMLKPVGSQTGTSTITVTVTDPAGNSSSKSFVATVVPDTANGAPFLNPIPTLQTTLNTPVTYTLTSQDKEGDSVFYAVQPLGTTTFNVSVDSASGLVTVVPPTGFTGELQFRAIVQQTTATTTSSVTDTQTVRVLVSAATQTPPTGLDLLAASDSGVSSTDNITNAQTLTFAVAGTQAGAFVEVRAGGNVVGSATASGTTTEVTVNNAAAIGQGSTLFTARQTLGGVASTDSPPLTVVLDNVAPSAIATSVFPASIVVGQNFSLDLAHPEEGQGLIYAISGAPTGLTIDSQTGQIAWTPLSTQIGTRELTLRLTDIAGNVLDQVITINVVEQPQARITLNAVSLTGTPLTTVGVGETFKVQLVVEDQREGSSRTGVFAVYVDLLFDPETIEPVAENPINHIAPYRGSPLSGTVSAGLIDELGSYSTSTPQLGPEARVFAEVTFRAKAPGAAGLRTEAADVLGNDILLYDEQNAIADSRVLFGTSNFVVGANFQLVDDVFNFDEDSGTHNLTVLANDTVSGGAVLTITSVGTTSSGGTVTIAADGRSLNYTSAANFAGAETFTYTASNQQGVSGTATVTVQVTDVNDPPVAVNDVFTVFRNSTQNILQVLLNDTSGVDAPGAETLSVTAVSPGSAGGTITVGSSGLTVRYTPAANFLGTETFTYTLSDGRGGTDTATVSVSVTPQNPPPTAVPDTFTVVEDAALATFDVLANDTTDDPTETLSVSAVGGSQVGSTFTVTPGGQSVSYRPASNFNGQEVLTYTLLDSNGGAAIGTVTFNVTPVNDPPTAVDDTFSVLASQSTTTLDVLANDTNVDEGEILTISAVTQPPAGNGTIAIAADGKSLIYTSPSSTFEGTFTIVYTLSDGTDLTDTATVTINVNNFIPWDLSGVVELSGSSGFLALTLPAIKLVGTDITGAAVNTSIPVMNNAFNLQDVAPGTYQLEREPLPFLNDAGASVPINASVEAAGAPITANLAVSGNLLPQFINLRDFLGSSFNNSLTVAVNGSGASQWIASSGTWSQLTSLTASANSGNSTLTVNGVNAAQQNVRATVPINGTRTAQVGQEGSMRLIRVWGATTDVGVAPVPTTPNSTTPATNTALNAEGEGELTLPAINSTTLPAAQTGLSQGSVSQGSNNASGLTQVGGIQSLLGSTLERQATRGASNTGLSSGGVDAAMASMLPGLRLQLGDDLEHMLTSENDVQQTPNDTVLRDF